MNVALCQQLGKVKCIFVTNDASTAALGHKCDLVHY